MSESRSARKSIMSLSVVLPAYNEEEVIIAVLRDILTYLPRRFSLYEVVVVNDGSTDSTRQLVEDFMATSQHIRLVNHSHNKGYGEALRSGFNLAQHEWILLIDSDGQFSIETLNTFLPLAGANDFVIGRRSKRSDPLLRSLFTAGYNTLVQVLLGVHYDFGCAFKLFRRTWWQRLQPIHSTDHKIFSVELLWRATRAGARITELPVAHFPRQGGVPTGASLRTIGPMMQALLRLWLEHVWHWLTSSRGQVFWLILATTGAIFSLGFFSFAYYDAGATGQPLVESFLTMWYRWDANHYLEIARTGYQLVGEHRNLIVFFPLFPALTASLAELIGSYRWAGLVVANGASIVGLYLFYRLARLEFSATVARAAFLSLLLWPTAFFFHAPYTEGLFLLLSVAAFWAARKTQWPAAGIFGGLAALTRVTGILLLPALLVEYWLQRREGKPTRWRVLWLALIPAGLAVYLLINQIVYGQPFAFVEIVKEHWGKQLAWPWQGMAASWEAIGSWPWSHYGVTVGVAEFIAGSLLAVLTLISFRFLRLSYAIYTASMAWLVLSTSFLLSTPRYLLTIFPLFFLLGNLSKHPTLFASILVCQVVLLGFLTSVFVRGWWAF